MVIGGLGTVLTAAYFLLMLSRVTHGRGIETIHVPRSSPRSRSGPAPRRRVSRPARRRATRRPGFPAGPAGRRHRARARRLDPAVVLIVLLGLVPRSCSPSPRRRCWRPSRGWCRDPHARGAAFRLRARRGDPVNRLRAIAVPLILACAAGLVLLLDAFLPDRPGSGRAVGLVALGGVLAALAATAVQGAQGVERRTFCVPASLGGGRSRAPPCSFVVDRFTLVFAGLVLAAGVVVVLLSMAELATGRIPVGRVVLPAALHARRARCPARLP